MATIGNHAYILRWKLAVARSWRCAVPKRCTRFRRGVVAFPCCRTLGATYGIAILGGPPPDIGPLALRHPEARIHA
jgi:hypothetical protein